MTPRDPDLASFHVSDELDELREQTSALRTTFTPTATTPRGCPAPGPVRRERGSLWPSEPQVIGVVFTRIPHHSSSAAAQCRTELMVCFKTASSASSKGKNSSSMTGTSSMPAARNDLVSDDTS